MVGKREFRTAESLMAEEETRNAVVGLLEKRGFTGVEDVRKRYGNAVSQTVSARAPDGVRLSMHVRLCWRRDGRNSRERTYSAAQLRARLIDGDWDKTLDFISSRDVRDGNPYNLIVQYDRGDFVHAALIPSNQLAPIWRAQKEMSDRLINAGMMGRNRKNHATNGSSPTLWLQDERAPQAHQVPDLLWSWPGVIDVLALPVTADATQSFEDSVDDLYIDPNSLGRDAGERLQKQVSGYPRDPKVRREVARRADGACERPGCRAHRSFPGFLDVHHILGVAASDRAWTCVALCPNCHREAHFAPDRDEINRELALYAARYAPSDVAA